MSKRWRFRWVLLVMLKLPQTKLSRILDFCTKQYPSVCFENFCCCCWNSILVLFFVFTQFPLSSFGLIVPHFLELNWLMLMCILWIINIYLMLPCILWIDDFRKSQGRKFSAIFPTVTELRHLRVSQTLLFLLCCMLTRMEAVCKETRDFSELSDLQALCVCVCVCVCMYVMCMPVVCMCTCHGVCQCVLVCVSVHVCMHMHYWCMYLCAYVCVFGHVCA